MDTYWQLLLIQECASNVAANIVVTSKLSTIKAIEDAVVLK